MIKNKKEVQDNFKATLAERNWIGNSLNQIAKVLDTANRNNFLSDIDFDEMKDVLQNISNDIEEIMSPR